MANHFSIRENYFHEINILSKCQSEKNLSVENLALYGTGTQSM